MKNNHKNKLNYFLQINKIIIYIFKIFFKKNQNFNLNNTIIIKLSKQYTKLIIN